LSPKEFFDYHRINFYSKDMVVKDALITATDNNKIVVSVHTIFEDSNSVVNATEPLIFLTSMLTAKQKEVTVVVNIFDDKGNLINCLTNYGDVMRNEDINREACLLITDNAEAIITLDIPNPALNESRVNIYPLDKTIEIKPRTKDAQIMSVYLILKSNYPELEETLSKIEAIKNQLMQLESIQDKDSERDANVPADTNLEIDTN